MTLRLLPGADDWPTDDMPALTGDQTREIPLLHLLPPVPPATVVRRVARSRFADDLRQYGWLVGLILAGLLCLILTRGEYVTFGGLESIPGGAR